MNNQTQYVSVDILKVHPQNTEFFDDISGQDYEDFKKSIQEDGIISDIIVAPDMTIVSGHQRYKAAKELGIKMVPVQIREDLMDDDKKLRVLLAANFGRKKNSEAKKRKIAVEYVKLCGYKHGGDRSARRQHGALTTAEIAAHLGTSERSLQRALRIENKLTDSMKQILDEGVISQTVASDVIASLTPEEQEQLISSLPVTEKLTQKKIQEEIDKMKSNSPAPEVKEVQVIPEDYEDLKRNNIQLQKDNEKLKNKTNEVVNLREEVENYKKDYNTMKRLHDEKADEAASLKAQIRNMEASTPEAKFIQDLKDSSLVFCGGVNNFIKKYGGYIWITEKINQLPEFERKQYIRAIQTIKDWALNMEVQINMNISHKDIVDAEEIDCPIYTKTSA